jgi:hypothetical protein
MASLAEDIVIRPVCLQDAAALWAIARQGGSVFSGPESLISKFV